jgi:hypothetical protein
MTRVELLYFEGCPHHERLLECVRELLSAHKLLASLEPVPVGSEEEARARRFLGSPSLRVDGVDVEPGADERTDFGLKCRLFLTPEGLRSAPADAWVLAALHRASRPLSSLSDRGRRRGR